MKKLLGLFVMDRWIKFNIYKVGGDWYDSRDGDATQTKIRCII